MLESIVLRNVATFDSTGIEISNLKKINFIYGANGCGKTTITKVASNPSETLYANCLINWKNDIAVKLLVYNKDFRDRNFGKGNIDGVFTLGQATKEQIEAIQKMQDELLEIKDKGIKKKDSFTKLSADKELLENEFKESVWVEIYKKHEDEFKDAFVGVLRKEAFKAKIIHESESNKAILKTYDELAEKAKTIFGETPLSISLITDLNFTRLIEIEENEIWQKKILGKADIEISKLIQRLNLNDWVNEGRNYLQEDETCPFCQQPTIGDSFREQLEGYFDESFTNDTNSVKSLTEEYNRIAANISNLLQLIEVDEKGKSNSKLEIETFSVFIRSVLSQFISNKELLNSKIKEPSRSINLVSIKKQLEDIQELIEEANKTIRIHNSIVTNYSAERSELISCIWKFLIEEHKLKVSTFNKKFDGLQRGIDALERQRQDLQSKYTAKNKTIKEANKNVTSVQPSVDEINKTLKSYGFLNFEIVPSTSEANRYQIHREDGTIAETTLSEGEITFITFLYFLQLCKGSTSQETITEERVLIVDDPISSLDSNVLFVVSSLIKEIIKTVKKDEGNIKQLILLTHNVYFHKEVSFIDGRTLENGETFYWILRRNKNVSAIQCYEMKNPIHNSYELLWNELKNRKELSGVTIQNTMRRIIENYFKILGKYGDDDLINKFENSQEQEICRSLICWINDGSHSIPDDLFVEHNDTIVDKYFDVFKGVFVEMGHPEHYEMMMRKPA
jgi:wobble nucleotide-excising tRNase